VSQLHLSINYIEMSINYIEMSINYIEMSINYIEMSINYIEMLYRYCSKRILPGGRYAGRGYITTADRVDRLNKHR